MCILKQNKRKREMYGNAIALSLYVQLMKMSRNDREVFYKEI